MASTNKTINYELSQYNGNDKPTYLGDYNSDMSKIDTQMKANNDATVTAKSTATNASETANTALVNAETALANAETAKSTATNALEKALSNEEKLSKLIIERDYVLITTYTNNYIEVEVTFKNEFATVPQVMLTPESGGTGNGVPDCAIKYGSITTTGFKMIYRPGYSAGYDNKVYYLAIV